MVCGFVPTPFLIGAVFMWKRACNYSRLWTICKDIDFCGGSPSYIEDKDREMLLIKFINGNYVYVEYMKKQMICSIKTVHKDNITPWKDGLEVRYYKYSDTVMKNGIQRHIDKAKALLN